MLRLEFRLLHGPSIGYVYLQNIQGNWPSETANWQSTIALKRLTFHVGAPCMELRSANYSRLVFGATAWKFLVSS